MSDVNAKIPSTGVRRWLPLLAVAALIPLTFGMGWDKYLTLKSVGVHYDALQGFIARNEVTALVLYVLAYIAVVALSLPGALVMTLTGGLLFGWQVGTPASVLGATTGATIIFLIVKTSFGVALAAKAGPWLGKVQDGFRENALSYLLFLRLVPAFPFFVVNVVPALLGVPLRTFVLGTCLGIIPGTTAFSVAGAGLGSAVEAQNRTYKTCLAKGPENPDLACPYTIDTSALVTTELLVGIALLGVVALIPVALKKWSKRHATA
jgi:uncharacterized membrane protein YdjX (TVP38/TMEM64 family)